MREKAVHLATKYHAGQKYGDRPYVEHLAEVESVLLRFGQNDPELLIAAWLHDLLEDTDCPPSLLQDEFGDQIYLIVSAVTDEPGENRKERKLATYPKIRAVGSKAVIVKLADRIANAEACAAEGKTRLTAKYVSEYSAFREHLYRSGEAQAMWEHLDKLMA